MSHRFHSLLLIIPLITLTIGVLIATIVSHRMTPQYQSTAVLEIIGTASPEWIPEKIASLISSENLAFASRDMDLVTRWGINHEESVDKLREHIRVRQITGTDLIEIRALHPSNLDAMDIAMAVIIAADRMHAEEVQQNFKLLRDAISEQESRVFDLRMQLAAEIPYSPHPDSSEPSDVEQRHQVENDLLMSLMSKAATFESDNTRRSNPQITFHDHPEIASHPLYPNIRLNLILGATTGLLLGIPLALVIMTLLQRLRPGYD